MRVVDAVEVMFGWQWEGRVIERFCEFAVDGREGWGVSEWHFRFSPIHPKVDLVPPYSQCGRFWWFGATSSLVSRHVPSQAVA